MKKSSIKYLFLLLLAGSNEWSIASGAQLTDSIDIPLSELARQFVTQPVSRYRPYVWWHWMGSNFSKEGITKDLESMAESGIGGATIFNLASAVQESHTPIGNNPWPEQTYRSMAYWEAMKHAASEAKRLGLKIGLQGTPGYSTTGGPWITEERGMQMLVSTKKNVSGGQQINVKLEQPVPPIYSGWGSSHIRATYYKDIAVMAVPEKGQLSVTDVLNISAYMEKDGTLLWNAPGGNWTIIRLGHAPTMANPHPLPDELIGKALEADKMSKEQSIYHWTNVLEPLQDNLREYLGDSFTYILTDSYEAGNQNWTKNFKNDFIRFKGYDPVPFLALVESGYSDNKVEGFKKDYNEVIEKLFMDNGWKIGKKMINEAGLDFYWEPYIGQFDTHVGVGLADLPMGEFWTGGDWTFLDDVVKAAADYGKKIVGAEAFTGAPAISQYTEDPEFLKPSTDMAFVSGANRLFLHHWVHQPFDDKYQPGMGMGWWGTHFGRNQTWIKPAKAFFTYLSRCQMMLQQGKFVSTDQSVLHRSSTDAEIYFIINSSDSYLDKEYAFKKNTREKPELWDAYSGTILNSVRWRNQKDSVYVRLSLHPHESMFVVLPKIGKNQYGKINEELVQRTVRKEIDGEWHVKFYPKLLPSFEKTFTNLTDFTESNDERIKYFSGTAVYRKNLSVSKEQLKGKKKFLLDLGRVNDIVEVRINGKQSIVLWYPPYQADVTRYLQEGNNLIELYVTNNWANRLIGDEQYPADFEWGKDRGELGRAMKSFPDWFLKNQERPEKNRKGFLIWYYHRKDSPLQPAGLCGPVRLIEQYLND